MVWLLDSGRMKLQKYRIILSQHTNYLHKYLVHFFACLLLPGLNLENWRRIQKGHWEFHHPLFNLFSKCLASKKRFEYFLQKGATSYYWTRKRSWLGPGCHIYFFSARFLNMYMRRTMWTCWLTWIGISWITFGEKVYVNLTFSF